jgi:hypothetical protein
MSDPEKLDEADRPGQRRKTRTWWYPLLVSVVDYLSEGVFDVRAEMTVDHAIMQVLTESGHTALLYYILQQVQQFQLRREESAMQHTALEYMDEVSEELKASVIAAIPAEDRLRGLTAQQILECVSLEEILAGLPAEERLRGLSPAERRRLRNLLDQDLSK